MYGTEKLTLDWVMNKWGDDVDRNTVDSAILNSNIIGFDAVLIGDLIGTWYAKVT